VQVLALEQNIGAQICEQKICEKNEKRKRKKNLPHGCR
jgi:hypothetical protein